MRLRELFCWHKYSKWIDVGLHRLVRACIRCGKIQKHDGLKEYDKDGNVFPYEFKH